MNSLNYKNEFGTLVNFEEEMNDNIDYMIRMNIRKDIIASFAKRLISFISEEIKDKYSSKDLLKIYNRLSHSCECELCDCSCCQSCCNCCSCCCDDSEFIASEQEGEINGN